MRNPFTDPPLPPVFNPEDEAAINQAIHDLCQDSMTLSDVALVHKTSLPALTAWMARPEIAERIDNLENAMRRRARLVAANSLTVSITALRELVLTQLNIDSHTHSSLRQTPELAARARESTRKAATLLTRIAFKPLPEGGVGVGSRDARTQQPAERATTIETDLPLPDGSEGRGVGPRDTPKPATFQADPRTPIHPTAQAPTINDPAAQLPHPPSAPADPTDPLSALALQQQLDLPTHFQSPPTPQPQSLPHIRHPTSHIRHSPRSPAHLRAAAGLPAP